MDTSFRELFEVSPDAILEVDREGAIRLVNEEAERLFGYTTLLAASGKQALDMLSHVSPAAILLDLLMPEMDGFEVLRRLREDRMSRDIPVFILTAKDLTEQDLNNLAGQTRALFLKGDAWREALVAQLRRAVREGLA